jgi:hypothetical protein
MSEVGCGLYWHCCDCGANEAVEPTEPPYTLGDHEPCECGGTARVLTLKQGAQLESLIARGVHPREAQRRVLQPSEHDPKEPK